MIDELQDALKEALAIKSQKKDSLNKVHNVLFWDLEQIFSGCQTYYAPKTDENAVSMCRDRNIDFLVVKPDCYCVLKKGWGRGIACWKPEDVVCICQLKVPRFSVNGNITNLTNAEEGESAIANAYNIPCGQIVILPTRWQDRRNGNKEDKHLKEATIWYFVELMKLKADVAPFALTIMLYDPLDDCKIINPFDVFVDNAASFIASHSWNDFRTKIALTKRDLLPKIVPLQVAG